MDLFHRCPRPPRLTAHSRPPQADLPRRKQGRHVDRIAMKHDVDYLTARTEQDIRRADQRMLRNLGRSRDSKFNVIPAKMGIASKVKLEDAGLMKKDKFIYMKTKIDKG